MRILIVEDMEAPLWSFGIVIKELGDGHIVHIAKWYLQAKEMLGENQYDVVFLDHRMPYDKPRCTEDEDFKKFCAQLQDIGYGLIDFIHEKSPTTVIIGTSTLPREKIEEGGYGVPDRTVEKIDIQRKFSGIIAELSR